MLFRSGKNGDGRSNDGALGAGASGDDRSADGKNSDGRSSDGKNSDGRSSDDRSSDGKASGKADGRSTRGGDGKTGERQGGRKATAARDSGKHKSGPGILSVQAVPWSWVTVDIETKETPAKFYLAPGTHIVKLYNEANGLTKYEKVVIEADKLQKLNEDMER